jgi:exopolyphosphatase/guanosine-5'-triphosphate,3'-diphosphate pyrophosphatase
VRVGIIDIGSNTARLLVADPAGRAIEAVREERAVLALGEQVERDGRISDLKLAETAERARAYARLARKLGCASIDVFVTAPGRQSANSAELVHVLERATRLPVRVLSPEEEGRLAYAGALAQGQVLRGPVAVCDVGGGSTEVVVGGTAGEPRICRSLELGSLRLTRRVLAGDPPGKKAIAAAKREVEGRLENLELPPARVALATGGSARSLRKLVGSRTLGREELAFALKRASKRGSDELATNLGLDPVRAETLLAGALILAGVQERLGLPLEVARGGLREGAAHALLTEQAAA